MLFSSVLALPICGHIVHGLSRASWIRRFLLLPSPLACYFSTFDYYFISCFTMSISMETIDKIVETPTAGCLHWPTTCIRIPNIKLTTTTTTTTINYHFYSNNETNFSSSFSVAADLLYGLHNWTKRKRVYKVNGDSRPLSRAGAHLRAHSHRT